MRQRLWTNSGYRTRFVLFLRIGHTMRCASTWHQRRSEVVKFFIAAAGGAAHLAGVVAGKTVLPVLGVPMESKSLGGMDSLLSTVQMPAGIPVGTLAIGKPGAINAALLSAAILGGKHPQFSEAVKQFRKRQADAIIEQPDPRL